MTLCQSTPGGIRTPNQRIRNPLLYPLSYGRFSPKNPVLMRKMPFSKTEVWHWLCQCWVWRISVNGPFWQAGSVPLALPVPPNRVQETHNPRR